MNHFNRVRVVVLAVGMSIGNFCFGQEVDSYPSPRAPSPLVPQAPSFSPADLEVDDFLRIPDARERFAVTGKGLGVVVIDSGINTQHVMFAGRLLDGRNFSEDGAADEMRDTGGTRALESSSRMAMVPTWLGSSRATNCLHLNRCPRESLTTRESYR